MSKRDRIFKEYLDKQKTCDTVTEELDLLFEKLSFKLGHKLSR